MVLCSMPVLTLRAYQDIAVSHLERNPKAGLFLDMGLGKTATVLRSLKSDQLPALVIAPKRVAENVWEVEAEIWRPDLQMTVASGSASQRKIALSSSADVVVIGRDNIRDVLPYASKFKTVVIDEMSGFKNQGSVRWKTARKIVATATYVYGLTGTPVPNGLLDLWAQMYLLDGGQRLGKNMGLYRARYFTPGRQLANGVITEWHLRPEAAEKIYDLIGDICLSMDSEGRIELPPVTYNPVTVPLDSATRKVYKDMKDTLVADMQVLGGEVHTAANAAVLSSKLRQICSGFLFVDEADLRDAKYDLIHHEKIRAIGEILESTGSPVLIFYQFLPERDMIRAAFPKLVHLIDEKDIIAKWNRGEIPVLLVHPQSVGHGLNLQHGGHTVIWSSLTWSSEDWEQGNKRLFRSGQEHPVVIHMLISPNTVDEAMRARVLDKVSVHDALMAHLQSPL